MIKTKIVVLILLLFILEGCTLNKTENLPNISDLIFPVTNQPVIIKNEIKKTIVCYKDSLHNTLQVGYNLFDSLGNVIYINASTGRTRLKYDSLGFLIKKEFITDYIASFSIRYDFFPKERKLHQIWFKTQQSLETMDPSEMPLSDTTILIFSSENLLLSENGYWHEDKEVKSIAYKKAYQYDSLNRVKKITTLYLNLEKDFRYMTVLHNPFEGVMLSSKPKIEETFRYQGKSKLIIQKKALYTDLSEQRDSFIIKTLYDARGLEKEVFNLVNQSSLKYFHATSVLE
ncbi:hypothetical protein [Aureispira sp. CCB-E]|uniref:hypothetical protein n=1 Tax=Aureispira sp. CCB-E TaxID=3051121 RepID=UPI002868A228|nr:hypothetical protein [Aureispira sp. CCB-E]WMX12463.1 hypothetical protein QP953_16665 [Aureispira sp. CCB-E]